MGLFLFWLRAYLIENNSWGEAKVLFDKYCLGRPRFDLCLIPGVDTKIHLMSFSLPSQWKWTPGIKDVEAMYFDIIFLTFISSSYFTDEELEAEVT